MFVFVNADTVVRKAIQRGGRTSTQGRGGGCSVRFDRRVPPFAVLVDLVLRLVSQPTGLAAGCSLYCPREAYDVAGGFDEALFATEAGGLARRRKRMGLFVVLRNCVRASGR